MRGVDQQRGVQQVAVAPHSLEAARPCIIFWAALPSSDHMHTGYKHHRLQQQAVEQLRGLCLGMLLLLLLLLLW